MVAYRKKGAILDDVRAVTGLDVDGGRGGRGGSSPDGDQATSGPLRQREGHHALHCEAFASGMSFQGCAPVQSY